MARPVPHRKVMALIKMGLFVTLFAGFIGAAVSVLSGCASEPYESDHWRDAVRADKGLLNGR